MSRASAVSAVPFRRRLAALAATVGLAVAMAAGVSLAPVSPAAAQVAAADLSPAESQALDAAEAYLDGLTTMEARFVQVGATGGMAEGTFYLKRPGRLRIEYDDEPHLVVADGYWLTYWDEELGQRSDAPLGSTLAGFLVREDISFTGEITVTDVRLAGGSTEIDLVQTEDPGAGQLTLDFDGRPDQGDGLALRRWIIRDAQGARTEVALLDIQRGVDLANSLFRAPRPEDRRNN